MLNPESLAYKEPPKKKIRLPSWRKPSKRAGIIMSSVLGVLILATAGWYSYGNLRDQFFSPKTEPPQSNFPPPPPQQVLGLIESVEKKGIDLPDNEYPSVATVSNLDTLSDQAFFNGATVGDKVLIYAAAHRAILYRPSSNEIIRQGSVEVVTDPNQPATGSAVLSASDSAEGVLRVKF